ncbi:MAG: Uma2 family endonuclease [Cyanobacteria bacterium P01_E01_bin.42]
MLLLDPQTQQPASEQRILLHEVSWEEYLRLSDVFIDSFPRIHYLEGTLELIMSHSSEHERLKTIIARLLETYAMERRLELNGYGNTTFRRQVAQRGAEPDECYCLGVLGNVPDIVLEVVLTSGGIEKLSLYGGLGISEVWFWEEGEFRLYCWQGGDYILRDRSVLLPDLDFSLLSQFVGYENQTEAAIAFRDALNLEN